VFDPIFSWLLKPRCHEVNKGAGLWFIPLLKALRLNCMAAVFMALAGRMLNRVGLKRVVKLCDIKR